jgi:hypothetical protein
MKYLLIAFLFLIGCTSETGGKYRGKIVEMVYSNIDHGSNRIDVLTGTETKRIYNCPSFDRLNPGDEVIVQCSSGFFGKCYITAKITLEEKSN